MQENGFDSIPQCKTPIRDFVSKHALGIGFFALTVVSFLLRISLWDAITGDYSWFLTNWIRELGKYPGISGIGQNIGEYNVPYMLFLAVVGRTPANNLYEIKAFSVFFDYLGAFFAIKTVSFLRGTKLITPRNLFLYAAILFSPAIFLDSAFWAQCDMIYSAICLVCLYEMFRERYNSAMCFFGLALAFKLQALFFLPVILIYFFSTKKMKARSFLFAPAIFLLCDLPAILAGRSISDTLLIYVKQTGIYKELTKNCPNLYYIIGNPGNQKEFYDLLHTAGILLTLAVLGIAAVIIIRRRSLTKQKTVLLATWCALAVAWLLPGMHERYTFMACVFAIVWAALTPRDWWVALGINLVTLCSYTPYLFHGTSVDMRWLALFNLAFLVYLTIRLFGEDKVTDGADGNACGNGVPDSTGASALSGASGMTAFPRTAGNSPDDATVACPAEAFSCGGCPDSSRAVCAASGICVSNSSGADGDAGNQNDVCAVPGAGTENSQEDSADEGGQARGKFCVMCSTGKRQLVVPVRCVSVSFTLPFGKKRKETKEKKEEEQKEKKLKKARAEKKQKKRDR